MIRRNDVVRKLIHIVCWLIFVGYCIQTGALLFNYIYSLFRPIAAHNLYEGLNLALLYTESRAAYSLMFLVSILISALKAYVFYLVLGLFKVLDMVKPFSENISRIISGITTFSFATGIASVIARQFVERLTEKGYDASAMERFWNDSGAYLMMSAVLFVVSLVFRKGLELQNETDLTV